MSSRPTWIALVAYPLGLFARPLDLGAAPHEPLSLHERTPLVLIVVSPKGSRTETGPSEILRKTALILEPKTSIAVKSPEQAGADVDAIQSCEDRSRLSCWVLAIRRDEGRTAKHRARYLVVMSLREQGRGVDRISAMLFDLDRAATAYNETPRDRSNWVDVAENRIFETAIESHGGVVDAREAGALEQLLRRVFLDHFRPGFERNGHWEPFGRIEIEKARPGLIIDIDGKTVGSADSDVAAIDDVLPGRHSIALTDPSGALEPWRGEVEVARGETRAIAALLVERKSAISIRGATFWTGIGVGVLGLGLSAYAVLAPAHVARAKICSGASCSAQPPEFASFCEKSASDPSSCSSGGVLVAPLGFAMIGTGAAWSLGSELLEADGRIPWISLLGGIVLGGAVYGVSAAVGRH
jgi:hypothetical protein